MGFKFQMLRAFLLGVREFRWGIVQGAPSFTTGFDDLDLQIAYDWGREWAHRITLRRWDWE